jgi:hypothetical protein
MQDQLGGDPFAPLFPVIEPQPIAESIMAGILRAKKWAMSLKYAERLLVLAGHRFPSNLQSMFCTLVLDELDHYVKRCPDKASLPLLSLSRIWYACQRIFSRGDAN